jgi:hypothetical protein
MVYSATRETHGKVCSDVNVSDTEMEKGKENRYGLLLQPRNRWGVEWVRENIEHDTYTTHTHHTYQTRGGGRSRQC